MILCYSEQHPELEEYAKDTTELASILTMMHAAYQEYWRFHDYGSLNQVDENQFYFGLLSSLFKHINSKKQRNEIKSYIEEWESWKRMCPVGSIAFVRRNPKTGLETLMVRCKNFNYIQYSTTWVGGKADPCDESMWQTCVREVKEEIGIDISTDRSNVVSVIQHSRVFCSVLPITWGDERFLGGLKLQESEILSDDWVPLSLKLENIKVATKPKKISKWHSGTSHQLILTKDHRMPYIQKEVFKKLQILLANGIPNDPDDSISSLDITPINQFLMNKEEHIKKRFR